MQFKAQARANKSLGLWAAEKMGRTGEAAAEYAKEVIIADFKEAGHEDVVRKVLADLGDASSVDAIRAKMAETLIEAKKQVMTEV